MAAQGSECIVQSVNALLLVVHVAHQACVRIWQRRYMRDRARQRHHLAAHLLQIVDANGVAIVHVAMQNAVLWRVRVVDTCKGRLMIDGAFREGGETARESAF